VITVNEGQEGCAGFAEFSTFKLGQLFWDPKTADAYAMLIVLVRFFCTGCAKIFEKKTSPLK